MLDQSYHYALEKFGDAVHTLAVGQGDVRSRLVEVFEDPLACVDQHHIPSDLREEFEWLTKAVTRYEDNNPILRAQEAKDPQFRERHSSLYLTPLRATMRRIQNRTGSKIADAIYRIFSALDEKARSTDMS